MLKKIVLGTLLVGLIGILVVGAVIRTMDKTALVAEAHGPGYGRGNGEAGAYAAGGSRGPVLSAAEGPVLSAAEGPGAVMAAEVVRTRPAIKRAPARPTSRSG